LRYDVGFTFALKEKMELWRRYRWSILPRASEALSRHIQLEISLEDVLWSSLVLVTIKIVKRDQPLCDFCCFVKRAKLAIEVNFGKFLS